MRTLFRLILLLLPFTAGAQQPDTTCYTYPLRNVAGYYSANFGEMRQIGRASCRERVFRAV